MKLRALIALALLLPLGLDQWSVNQWSMSNQRSWGSSPRGSALYRSLVGRSEPVRFRAIQQLQFDPKARRGALPDLIAAVEQLAGETAPAQLVRPSIVAIMNLIAEIQTQEAEDALVGLLDTPHVGIAMLSAEALGRNKYDGAIEALKKQCNRPDYQSQYAFRFNLVRALAQMQHPDAIEFLAELRRSTDGQLRFQIDTVLDEVTVDHFQGDAQRYEQFRNPTIDVSSGVEKSTPERESFFKAAKFEPESLQRIRLKPQQYYGIEIHAKRLMFIIDNSGSMKDYWVGMTRLDRAKAELTRVLLELPGDTEFAIAFFNNSVRYWRNELLPATEENKRQAIDFVRRLGYGDKTNTHGALRFALQFDDQLEAVFLLTDGMPTTGELVKKPAIVSDILHRNRFRHLVFNTIGIAVDASTRGFLEQLAQHSNGEFREAL